MLSTPPLTMAVLTATDDVKSKVSSTKGAAPATFVKTNVTPLTVNEADSPLLSPTSGLPSTLYSEVPCGQLKLSDACAAGSSRLNAPPSIPTTNTIKPQATFKRRRAPIRGDIDSLLPVPRTSRPEGETTTERCPLPLTVYQGLSPGQRLSRITGKDEHYDPSENYGATGSGRATTESGLLRSCRPTHEPTPIRLGPAWCIPAR